MRLNINVRLPLREYPLECDVKVQGDLIGLFGPSGCGKTSLLETIAGLRPKAVGHIELDEEIFLNSSKGLYQPPQDRRLGFVPQEGLLFPHLTVRQNLRYGLNRHQGVSPDELEDLCAHLQIRHLWDHKPSTLSGGERQRVSLGRALAIRPRGLLLDEPFASLDLQLKYQLLGLIKSVCETYGCPALFVSHDPIEVLALCDTLLAMDGGKVVGHGPPHRVLRDHHIMSEAVSHKIQNIIPGKVTQHREHTSMIEVSAQSRFETRLTSASVGESVWIHLPGHEILIAPRTPGPLSARNSVASRVTGIHERRHRCLIECHFEGSEHPITIEITPQTRERFALQVGSEFVAIFKATSCEVLRTGHMD